MKLTTHLQHSSDGKIAFDDPLGEHAGLSASSVTTNNNHATARSSLHVSALVYLRGDRHHHATIRFSWKVLVVAYLIFDILHLSGPRRIRGTITPWLRTPRPGCYYGYSWSNNGLQVSTDMASKALLERESNTAVSDTVPVRYKIAPLEENGGPSANVDPSQQQIPPLDDEPASPLQHASKLLHDMNADVQLNYKNLEHISDIHNRNGAMSTPPPDGRHAKVPTSAGSSSSMAYSIREDPLRATRAVQEGAPVDESMLILYTLTAIPNYKLGLLCVPWTQLIPEPC